jgi:hypothetical protein
MEHLMSRTKFIPAAAAAALLIVGLTGCAAGTPLGAKTYSDVTESGLHFVVTAAGERPSINSDYFPDDEKICLLDTSVTNTTKKPIEIVTLYPTSSGTSNDVVDGGSSIGAEDGDKLVDAFGVIEPGATVKSSQAIVCEMTDGGEGQLTVRVVNEGKGEDLEFYVPLDL